MVWNIWADCGFSTDLWALDVVEEFKNFSIGITCQLNNLSPSQMSCFMRFSSNKLFPPTGVNNSSYCILNQFKWLILTITNHRSEEMNSTFGHDTRLWKLGSAISMQSHEMDKLSEWFHLWHPILRIFHPGPQAVAFFQIDICRREQEASLASICW